MATARTPSRPATTIRGLRWWIVGLVFLITCVNYVDRTSIGLLFTRFGPEINISAERYSWVGAILLFAYTLSQALSGRLYDRYGARIGFTVSVVLWCVSAMAHSLIVGFASFAACSFFLGLGEAGNWPGAAKVVGEWFPESERALGMAIFNGGASMGGVVGPLLVATYLEPHVGWRWTFAIIGSLGFFWLIAWLLVYRPVNKHPSLSAEEMELILGGQRKAMLGPPPGVRELLRYKQTWAILGARFFVDPIWWLYMLWLPSYLKAVHHFNLKEIGAFQWAPYVLAACGSLFGGFLSGRLIRSGRTINFSRKLTIAIAACMMPFGIFAAHAHNIYAAMIFIGIVLFGFQMWISNVQTLPSDYFPKESIGTVAGMGGMAAGISSLFFNLCTGWVVTHFGYASVLTLAGVLAPIGAVCLFALGGTIQRLGDA